MPDETPGAPGGDRERPESQPTEPLHPEPQPPDYGQPPGYGPPGPGDWRASAPYGSGYGYPPPAQTESTATAALVIAIAGFFICMPVGAIVALIMANSAERKIKESGGRLTGLDQTKAARIIAIIELVITAIVVALGALLVISVTTSSRNALG